MPKAVKNLKTPRFRTTNPLVDYILKLLNHQSNFVIRNVVSGITFSFSRVPVNEILKNQNVRYQGNYRQLKENADIFEDFICLFFNKYVDTGTFRDILKHANITQVFTKGIQRL